MTTEPPANADPQRPSPELLLWAYRRGIFPMGEPGSGHIDWYSPDPRGIIPIEGFNVPKSMKRILRQRPFDIRFDTAFERVMRACAAPREPGNETWISEQIIESYTALHKRGHAHSVEAWLDDDLIGGLYGVSVGAAFFGESMFSRPERGGTNSSKICLVFLVEHLRGRGFTLLDTQFWTPHLDQFGCIEISREEYLEQLAEAVEQEERW